MGDMSYYDYAHADLTFLREAADAGIWGIAYGYMSQSICERFLKELVEQYVIPQTIEESAVKGTILHTHNLRVLVKYLEKQTDILLSRQAKNDINTVNGLYFTTRYPGDDSMDIEEDEAYEFLGCAERVADEVNRIIKERNKDRD